MLRHGHASMGKGTPPHAHAAITALEARTLAQGCPTGTRGEPPPLGCRGYAALAFAPGPIQSRRFHRPRPSSIQACSRRAGAQPRSSAERHRPTRLRHCPNSAPAPLQGAPGGSGQLGTPRSAHRAPSHCLGCSSQPPPKPPISPPLTMQARQPAYEPAGGGWAGLPGLRSLTSLSLQGCRLASEGSLCALCAHAPHEGLG